MLLKSMILCILCVKLNQAEYLNQTAITDSELRRGTVGAYAVSNGFLDSMAPSYSVIINLNAINFTINDLQTNLTNYLTGKDWRFYVDLIFKVLPGGGAFIVICIIYIILVPITGIVYCCVQCCRKCCCKSPREVFDTDNSKCKKWTIVIILYILLILLLLLVIALFLTNTYAFKSVNKTAKLLNQEITKAESFITTDIANFSKSTVNTINGLKTPFANVLNNTIIALLDRFRTNLSSEVNDIKNFVQQNFSSKLELITTINSLVVSPSYLNFRATVNNLTTYLNSNGNGVTATQLANKNNLQPLTVPSGLADLLNQLNDPNGFIPFDDIFSGVQDSCNNVILDAQDSVNAALDVVSESITAFTSNIDNYTTLLESLRQYTNPIETQYYKYYDYVYYVLIAVAALLLLIIVLLTLGTFGICCRSKASSKQTCHSGIGADFLMSGVGFYFIFSFIFMAIVVVLFVVGLAARQAICLPMIQLDDNSLIKLAKNANDFKSVIGNVSFKNVISQCRSSTSMSTVTELNSMLKNTFGLSFTDLTTTKTFMDKVDEQINALYDGINIDTITMDVYDIEGFYNTANITGIDISTLNKTLIEHKSQLVDIVNFLSTTGLTGQVITNTRTLLPNYTTTLSQVDAAFTSFAQFRVDSAAVVQTITSKLNTFKKLLANQTSLNEFVISHIKVVIDSLTRPGFEAAINQTLLKDVYIPSCQIIPNIYDDLSVNVCYELVDNLNGNWFTIWCSLMLYLFLIPLAIWLSKLLRIIYSFEKDSYDFVHENVKRKKSPIRDASAEVRLQRHVKKNRVHPSSSAGSTNSRAEK